MSHHVMTGKNVAVLELWLFMAGGPLLDFWKEKL